MTLARLTKPVMVAYAGYTSVPTGPQWSGLIGERVWDQPSLASPHQTPAVGIRRAITKTSDGYSPPTRAGKPSADTQRFRHAVPTLPQSPRHRAHLPFQGYGQTLPYRQAYLPVQQGEISQGYPQPDTLGYAAGSGSGSGAGVWIAEQRQQLSPPPGLQHPSLTPPPGLAATQTGSGDNNHFDIETSTSMFFPTMDDVTTNLGKIELSPTSSPALPASQWSTETADCDSDSDDNELTPSHPNKFPVEIEYHNSKFCSYKRQATRSGEKMKQKLVHSYDPLTLEPQTSLQQTKYYQKHLVRICKCGKYQMMDGALQQGRSNDCNGYEIHYSHKCKWKAYDDFKTGNRVLIRLCKCYKPT